MRTLTLCLIVLAAACRERPTAPAVTDTVPACLEVGNSRNKLRVVQCPDTVRRRPYRTGSSPTSGTGVHVSPQSRHTSGPTPHCRQQAQRRGLVEVDGTIGRAARSASSRSTDACVAS